MTRDGLLWELPMSVRPTNGTGSGLWPTPATKGYGHAAEGMVGNLMKKIEQGVITKQEAEQMLSLPKLENHRTWKKTFPTPTSRDYKGANGFETTQRKISEGKRAQMGQLPNALQQELGRPIGGTLNPNWTEWLMGWLPGWTDLKPLEMDKSLCVRQQHGENSIADHGTEP
jgi:hypothetical protein